jgi:hypothetical protein
MRINSDTDADNLSRTLVAILFGKQMNPTACVGYE